MAQDPTQLPDAGAGPSAPPSNEISVEDLIKETAAKHGVPAELALAVAEQESSFNPMARGPVILAGRAKGQRAIGTFQLVPTTAAMLGVDPNDPVQNIDGGVRYLKQLLASNKDDVRKALAQYGGVVRNTEYVPQVLARLDRRLGVAAPGVGAPMGGAVPGGGQTPPGVPNATPGSNAPAGGPAEAPSMADAANNLGWDLAMGQFGSAAKTVGNFFKEGVNPMTPQGRQNIASLVGETAMSAVPALRNAGAIARTGLPAMAGGTAAALETALENQLHTSDQNALGAGGMQAGYSLGGTALLWPAKRIVRGMLASTVGANAEAALSAMKTSVRDQAASALRTVRADLRASVDALTAAGRQAQDAVRTAGQQGVTAASVKAAGKVADAEARGAAAELAITRQVNDLFSQGPSNSATSQAMRDVLEGPAKRALDAAGQQVDAAAMEASKRYKIKIEPIQQSLNRMLSEHRPPSLYPATTKQAPGFVPPSIAARPANVAASTAKISPQEYQRLIGGVAQALPPDHPLPDVLRRISQYQGGPIPFHEAHQLKRLLDESVNWDKTASKHVEQITKGLRTQLRAALSIDKAYNDATGTFEQLVPLYRRGVGKNLARYVVEDPDTAATMLKASKPSSAARLKQLLVMQSAAGGDVAAGTKAWDAVRATWVHNNILAKGADNLGETLAALESKSPEFLATLFDDPQGKQVFSNLKQIADALAQAKAGTAATVDMAKTEGKQAVDTARQVARAQYRQTARQTEDALRAARGTAQADQDAIRQSVASRTGALTDAQARLKQSSLLRQTNVDRAMDVGRVGAAAYAGAHYHPAAAVFGVPSLLRIIRGDQGKDLLEWVAYSPVRTRMFVHAVTHPMGDRFGSTLLRNFATALAAEQAKDEVPNAPPASTTTSSATSPIMAP